MVSQSVRLAVTVGRGRTPAAPSKSRARRPRQLVSSVAAPEPPIRPKRWSLAVVEKVLMPMVKPTSTNAISATSTTRVISSPTAPSAYTAASTQAVAATSTITRVRTQSDSAVGGGGTGTGSANPAGAERAGRRGRVSTSATSGISQAKDNHSSSADQP